MKFKKINLGIIGRVVLLFTALLIFAFALLQKIYWLDIIVLPIILFLVIDFYRFNKNTQYEVDRFVESIHYRDFSRNFNTNQAPPALQHLRQGFNDINSTFKIISKEKEIQYQYLQKVLELVDTGILSYAIETGDIVWMNESLKQLLQIPYLKTIGSLHKRGHPLYDTIHQLKSGEHVITSLQRNNINIKIVLSATAFETEGKKYKLVAFQNVTEALDETESKAWQKLLSVMTHEIMNSVAPISSLADTLQHRLQQADHPLADASEIREDIELGISTIKKRSEGLLKFTETYRSLNKITKANMAKVFVAGLFENLHRLMQPTLSQKNIELQIILKEPLLSIEMDASLIEQVLINLITNAMDALKDGNHPQIKLSAYSNNNKYFIKVTDNGKGIPSDVIDKVFIPFFGTKKNGSGIGLSLCKQIMLVHKGNIQLHSIENEGTAFTLCF